MDEDEYEEERVVVMMDIPGVLDCNMFLKSPQSMKILGVDTTEPIVQIGNLVFSGEFQDTNGTVVFFNKPTENDEKAESHCISKTDKKLTLKRVFLEPRNIEAESSVVSNDVKAVSPLKAASVSHLVKPVPSTNVNSISTETFAHSEPEENINPSANMKNGDKINNVEIESVAGTSAASNDILQSKNVQETPLGIRVPESSEEESNKSSDFDDLIIVSEVEGSNEASCDRCDSSLSGIAQDSTVVMESGSSKRSSDSDNVLNLSIPKRFKSSPDNVSDSSRGILGSLVSDVQHNFKISDTSDQQQNLADSASHLDKDYAIGLSDSSLPQICDSASSDHHGNTSHSGRCLNDRLHSTENLELGSESHMEDALMDIEDPENVIGSHEVQGTSTAKTTVSIMGGVNSTMSDVSNSVSNIDASSAVGEHEDHENEAGLYNLESSEILIRAGTSKDSVDSTSNKVFHHGEEYKDLKLQSDIDSTTNDTGERLLVINNKASTSSPSEIPYSNIDSSISNYKTINTEDEEEVDFEMREARHTSEEIDAAACVLKLSDATQSIDSTSNQARHQMADSPSSEENCNEDDSDGVTESIQVVNVSEPVDDNVTCEVSESCPQNTLQNNSIHSDSINQSGVEISASTSENPDTYSTENCSNSCQSNAESSEILSVQGSSSDQSSVVHSDSLNVGNAQLNNESIPIITVEAMNQPSTSESYTSSNSKPKKLTIRDRLLNYVAELSRQIKIPDSYLRDEAANSRDVAGPSKLSDKTDMETEDVEVDVVTDFTVDLSELSRVDNHLPNRQQKPETSTRASPHSELSKTSQSDDVDGAPCSSSQSCSSSHTQSTSRQANVSESLDARKIQKAREDKKNDNNEVNEPDEGMMYIVTEFPEESDEMDIDAPCSSNTSRCQAYEVTDSDVSFRKRSLYEISELPDSESSEWNEPSGSSSAQYSASSAAESPDIYVVTEPAETRSMDSSLSSSEIVESSVFIEELYVPPDSPEIEKDSDFCSSSSSKQTSSINVPYSHVEESATRYNLDMCSSSNNVSIPQNTENPEQNEAEVTESCPTSSKYMAQVESEVISQEGAAIASHEACDEGAGISEACTSSNRDFGQGLPKDDIEISSESVAIINVTDSETSASCEVTDSNVETSQQDQNMRSSYSINLSEIDSSACAVSDSTNVFNPPLELLIEDDPMQDNDDSCEVSESHSQDLSSFHHSTMTKEELEGDVTPSSESVNTRHSIDSPNLLDAPSTSSACKVPSPSNVNVSSASDSVNWPVHSVIVSSGNDVTFQDSSSSSSARDIIESDAPSPSDAVTSPNVADAARGSTSESFDHNPADSSGDNESSQRNRDEEQQSDIIDNSKLPSSTSN